MKIVDLIAMILVLIGGLNWGLIGFFDFDLVSAIFGDMIGLTRLVYCLIGLSAVYEIVMWKWIRVRAKKK